MATHFYELPSGRNLEVYFLKVDRFSHAVSTKRGTSEGII